MANAPGGDNRSDDPAEAHQWVLDAEDLLQLLGRLYAILQRKHSGEGRQEGSHRIRCLGDLPGLHRENNGVNRANIFRFIARLGYCNGEIALRA